MCRDTNKLVVLKSHLITQVQLHFPPSTLGNIVTKLASLYDIMNHEEAWHIGSDTTK